MSITPIPKVIKAEVMKRDGYRCRYCGADIGPFEIDHIVPEVIGGPTEMWNLVTACESCNRSKHSKVGIFPYPIGFFNNGHHPYGEFEMINLINETVSFREIMFHWFWNRYAIIRAIIITILPLSIMFFIYDQLDDYGLKNMNFLISPLWFCLIPMAFILWERYTNYKEKVKEEYMIILRNKVKSGG